MPFLFPNSLLNEGMRSAVSCQVRTEEHERQKAIT